jgi:hypothetical protein
MKELDKGGQGPTWGCCAIEEEEDICPLHIFEFKILDNKVVRN